jgi:hypothetical protein
VVIGQTLPEGVQVMRVPNYRNFGFAAVNKQRVLVEYKSRKVIKVY